MDARRSRRQPVEMDPVSVRVVRCATSWRWATA